MAATCAELRSAQERPNCESRSEVCGMQRPDATCLRDFRKVQSMRQERPFVWISHWKQLRWAGKLGGARSQGVTRVGMTVLARLMESQIWCPPTGSVGSIGFSEK